MPECTQAERELLDALNGNPDKNIAEARAALAIARVPSELFELAVAARVAQLRANQMDKRAWDALSELGVPGRYNGMTKHFDEFYARIQAIAEERAGQ